MDIDPDVLEAARRFTDGFGARGRPLSPGRRPRRRATTRASASTSCVSTGLGEFLWTTSSPPFTRTSTMRSSPAGRSTRARRRATARSDVLLRMVELVSHYRSAEDVAAILRAPPVDAHGARRGPDGSADLRDGDAADDRAAGAVGGAAPGHGDRGLVRRGRPLDPGGARAPGCPRPAARTACPAARRCAPSSGPCRRACRPGRSSRF